MSETLEIYSTLSELLPAGLQDVEEVRILLEGDSVIDWQRLAFRDRRHVDSFLERLGLRMADAADARRLFWLHQEALAYLDRHLELPIGVEVRQLTDLRDLFLMASHTWVGRGGARDDDRVARDACILLKVMHVIQHATGRELLHQLPVPMNELFRRIEHRVFEAIGDMKASGVKVVGFAASRKAPESIITKLLARTDSLAAEVHDRLRFRIVTQGLDDLFSVLICLVRWVVPFNYVLPGESRNDLVDLEATLAADVRLRDLRALLQPLPGLDDRGLRVNRFSAAGFRTINFVTDIPVRVHDLVSALPEHDERHGRVVFLLAEFQILDQATEQANETGDNRHELYKQRQMARVVARLTGSARQDL